MHTEAEIRVGRAQMTHDMQEAEQTIARELASRHPDLTAINRAHRMYNVCRDAIEILGWVLGETVDLNASPVEYNRDGSEKRQ